MEQKINELIAKGYRLVGSHIGGLANCLEVIDYGNIKLHIYHAKQDYGKVFWFEMKGE